MLHVVKHRRCLQYATVCRNGRTELSKKGMITITEDGFDRSSVPITPPSSSDEIHRGKLQSRPPVVRLLHPAVHISVKDANNIIRILKVGKLNKSKTNVVKKAVRKLKHVSHAMNKKASKRSSHENDEDNDGDEKEEDEQ